MRSTMAVAIAAGVLLVTSACAGATSGVEQQRELSSQWVLTERGDVLCGVERTYGGYDLTDCDWSTLVDAFTHTTQDNEVAEGEWVAVENGGEIYCLTNRSYGGYEPTDCDYSSKR